jgi:cobalt-zinc-cadmium efflux system membrane fusion protein
MINHQRIVESILSIALATSLGCGNSNAPNLSTAENVKPTHAGHSHDAWWCAEHGVPEEVCALCNSKVAADFKAKGDWCREHDRPESQCFVCHPEKETEFVALYEAKYGTKPPTLR